MGQRFENSNDPNDPTAQQQGSKPFSAAGVFPAASFASNKLFQQGFGGDGGQPVTCPVLMYR